MAIGILDSAVFGSLWAPDRMRSIFDEGQRFERVLGALSALAQAQAEHGLIPQPCADEIAIGIKKVASSADLNALKLAYGKTGHSMAGLIDWLQDKIAAPANQYIYFGATVQDITDTVQATQLRDAWIFLMEQALKIEERLLNLTAKHRNTVMLGRTHGQAGAPITFGFKVSVWAFEFRQLITRLRSCFESISTGQLAGSVGVLSQYGSVGPGVRNRFLDLLNLNAPIVSWTNSRFALADFCQLLALMSSVCEKITEEVISLQRTEIAELSEGSGAKAIGSITMPQKRNPEGCEQVGTLARIVRHLSGAMLESVVHQNERDGKSWKAEWHLIPEVTCLSAAAIVLTRTILDGLEVHAERMLANLDATRELALAEAVLTELSKHMPPLRARNLTRELVQSAVTSGRSLKEEWSQNAELQVLLRNRAQRGSGPEFVFDYKSNVGQSDYFCDVVLKNAQKVRPSDLEYFKLVSVRP